jgi:hypothetical protein
MNYVLIRWSGYFDATRVWSSPAQIAPEPGRGSQGMEKRGAPRSPSVPRRLCRVSVLNPGALPPRCRSRMLLCKKCTPSLDRRPRICSNTAWPVRVLSLEAGASVYLILLHAKTSSDGLWSRKPCQWPSMIPRRVSTPTCERVLHGGTGVVAVMIGDEELNKGLLERGSRAHVIEMYLIAKEQHAHVIPRYRILRKENTFT